ncbi:Heterokaryon incompatibility protein (HET) domain containing protein [Rhypophila decipiens]
MRLLTCARGNVFRLTDDLTTDIPFYAILSHMWGPETDENKIGFKKLEFCAEQARRNGLEYFWVDTCCINKLDRIELQRSINSMFRWYRNATRCYVYLSDVSVPNDQTDMISAFRASKWFTRGWTLQELLAPASVEFFTKDHHPIGDKRSLEQHIHGVTGIAVTALRDNRLSRFAIEERFKWAKDRKTTYEEDWAYCLLGIFGVFMPPNYGEGRDYAIRRLLREIREASENDDRSRKRKLISLQRQPSRRRLAPRLLSDVPAAHGCRKPRSRHASKWLRTV